MDRRSISLKTNLRRKRKKQEKETVKVLPDILRVKSEKPLNNERRFRSLFASLLPILSVDILNSFLMKRCIVFFWYEKRKYVFVFSSVFVELFGIYFFPDIASNSSNISLLR